MLQVVTVGALEEKITTLYLNKCSAQNSQFIAQ